MVDQPWRRAIRLPAAAYRDAGSAWHVTIGTADRAARVFAGPDLARSIIAAVAERCATRDTGLDLCCLMPDHCHLIVQIRTTCLIDVIGDLKSRTTRVWWARGNTGPLWQRSFHDRGIRTPREYDETVRYILDNPIRAGLVEDWSAYPHICGSLIPLDPPATPPSSS